MEEKCNFDLLKFLPAEIITETNHNYQLNKIVNEDHITLFYITEGSNNSKQKYSFIIPRLIKKDKECYEVLGLLQGEMGKTQNGCIVFANSEPNIINKVLKWFKKEFDISINEWNWYVKVNMQEPQDTNYKNEVEQKVINHWINKTQLIIENAHPKVVTYTNVGIVQLKNSYRGCLMIEFKNNLFSQVFKKFLKEVTYRLHYETNENIKNFMRGLIAAEGSVQNDKKSGHYTVHISASNQEEREVYKMALSKISINLKIYENYKETLISEKENLIQLLKQGLMTMHKRKYAKFLNMIQNYPRITEETGYFNGKKVRYNQYPQEKINGVLGLYNSGITNTKEISEKTGIHMLKVQRIFKENSLGNRVIRMPEKLRKEMQILQKTILI